MLAREHPEHAQEAILDDQGETREGDHAFAPGPILVADVRVGLDPVYQHGPALLRDPADLEPADGDACVWAVQVDVDARAGQQLQHVAAGRQPPDARKRRVQITQYGFSAGLQQFAQRIALAEGDPYIAAEFSESGALHLRFFRRA